MKLVAQRSKIRFQQWVKPGKEQSVGELVSRLKQRGVRILAVESDRVLITDEES